MNSADNVINTNPLPLPPPILGVADQPGSSKAGDIAYEVFGMVPVAGTFIGLHHMYVAITSDNPVDGWEIAKIITQIFSILLVPQVILGLAHGIKAIVDYCKTPPLPPPVVADPLANYYEPVLRLTPDGLPFPNDAKDASGLPLPLWV